MCKNRLFISHAEKDYDYVRPFVELLYRIGLKEDDIFCSSISELGVPIKEDIYDYLRNILDSENVIPIFMLSENYYSSAACLNEMGAVWLKQKEYYTFLLPGFTFKEIRGAINPNKCSIKLDNSKRSLCGSLLKFKNDICKTFELQPISELRWEEYRDEFLSSIRSSSNECSEIIIDIHESEVFCVNEVNRGACEKILDPTRNQLTFKYNFLKTSAQQCSVVLFTGGIDLRKEFKNGKKLKFWLRASDELKQVTVEMHLTSRNPQHVIDVSNEGIEYSVSLNKFTNLEKLWECCNEICFVVDRSSAESGVIEIKDVSII